MAKFDPWDYTILAIVLIISASIGVYYRLTGGKQKTTREYLLADRSMGMAPVACSLTASLMSAVTMLGVSAENYQYGTQFVLINIAYILATPFITYLILPVFYRLKTASVYEYLEQRFGYATRLYASLAFTVQTVLYMGIVLYAPALALEAVTGLNIIFSILIVGVVCTFYSTLGGMKAVLVTDIFQSVLMFAALFAVIICAAIKAGGLGDIWEAARVGGRLEFFNFSVDPTHRHTFFTQLIGGMTVYLSLYGVNQVQVQRLLAVKSLKASAKSLWWSLPILMVLSATTCFSGLCMYYYYQGCDPLLERRISSRDQLMPLFVVDTMGDIPGLSGLFVSGIFSGSLSTISSAINSLSAVTMEDYIKPWLRYSQKKEISDARTAYYSKLLNLIFGAVCLAIAFLAGSIGGLLQAALSIFGMVGGPVLGLFTLGMYVQKANQKGVITSLTIGLAVSFWIGFGQPKPPIPLLPLDTNSCPNTNTTLAMENFNTTLQAVQVEAKTDYFYLYRISYMWYATIGFLITFITGIIFSWIYEKLDWDLNDALYTDSSRTTIKCDLFVPPVANSIRKRQMPLVVVTGTSSEIGNNSSRTASVAEEQNSGQVLAKSYTNLTELDNISTKEEKEETSEVKNEWNETREEAYQTDTSSGHMDMMPVEPKQSTRNIKRTADIDVKLE